MIVGGGFNTADPYLNTGGRYNPGTDSWTATSTTSAPAGRQLHTAVWTGSEMIVWGGDNGSSFLNTGGRYCASLSGSCANNWIPTSTNSAPDCRERHTAVWICIVMRSCRRTLLCCRTRRASDLNPGTDSWTATSTTSAPAGRYVHTAVWTGSEMIVWGGNNSSSLFNPGGRYNPGTDSWTA